MSNKLVRNLIFLGLNILALVLWLKNPNPLSDHIVGVILASILIGIFAQKVIDSLPKDE